ncbi:MAG: class I SAM-dependent methyltransferase [Verrucomicrobia bacterium]|nr:class I SAM-dependent methyltransferase [Verrucomicrobiota bacterium]
MIISLNDTSPRTLRTVLGIVVWLAAIEPSHAAFAGSGKPPAGTAIPYVATRNDAVWDMLWIANVGRNDVVYDLGSGDGRIVIAAVRDFGARQAVGIEIKAEQVEASRKHATQDGVSDRVRFVQGDLFTNDFGEATVVTLFLGHEANLRLRPKLLSKLKPGTRVVSHQFGMGEWLEDKSLEIRTVFLGMWGEVGSPFQSNPRVPDYTGNEPHYGKRDKISMWVVPAPVAGVWRGKFKSAHGWEECRLALVQRLSVVSGDFELAGKTNLTGRISFERSDLWGDHLRFRGDADQLGYGEFELKFDGHVRENTMEGTMALVERGQLREFPWHAKRDNVDFTGTWEWPCPTGPGSVRLFIEQENGHRRATYVDGKQTVPVTDFYDWGGGFYFTVLVGREFGGLRIAKDTGWLIGAGVLDRGGLQGDIEFHATAEDTYSRRPTLVRGGTAAPKEAVGSRRPFEPWAARLIKP